MFSQALFRILGTIAFLGVFHGVSVFASEEKSEKKEAASAGSADGEVTETQKKQLNEAQELQSKVQGLQARIKTKEDTINRLIIEKNQTKSPERVNEIIAEMVAEHREMSKLIVEYEQNRSLLRYRYPEKGYTGSRAYERMEVKPLDQMESQMSVEAKLKRNLKTVRSQYGEPVESRYKKKKAVQKKEASAPSLTEPIVFQK